MNTSLRAPALHTTQRTATCGCHPPRMSAPQAARSAHCSRALPTGRGEQHDGAPALSRRSLGLGLVLSAGVASVTLPAQAELQTAPAPPAPTTITTPSGIKLQVRRTGPAGQSRSLTSLDAQAGKESALCSSVPQHLSGVLTSRADACALYMPQVVVEGSGAQPKEGDTVLIDYVLRRSNGYFIYSTVEVRGTHTCTSARRPGPHYVEAPSTKE